MYWPWWTFDRFYRLAGQQESSTGNPTELCRTKLVGEVNGKASSKAKAKAETTVDNGRPRVLTRVCA